jgi:tetratricopeptide (TPR) repeat protein
VIVGHGRRYMATNTPGTDSTDDFVRMWHRAAMGLLQGAADPLHLENHVADLGHANGGPAAPSDGRVMLARAVAQERRCWSNRPSIDQPAIRVEGLLATAGVRVQDDAVGPSKSQREALVAKHSACLREALSRFEPAVVMDDVADEARVRGGWTLIQDGRPKEAIEWLDAATPEGDRDLEYWRALFRGRALDALGRSQDAAEAYQAALALYPRAQSAGLGLALALMHLNRAKEADEVARSVREAGLTTPDPWEHYTRGDDRFASTWIDSLRATVR